VGTHFCSAKGASTELQKRLAFEQRIKRPYFHVKPLDETQLTNWHAYLDFEEQQEDKV
jgi:pre-mRNA-processing factor 39